jgi:hypothetical protein
MYKMCPQHIGGLALYKLLVAPLDRWAVSITIFGTIYYGILCRAWAFMTYYVIYGYLCCIISSLNRRDGYKKI